MFERFSQEARQVVVCAQDEARALNHHYIGTEHILLGLLREEERVGAGAEQPLHSLGITLEDVRGQVRRMVGVGAEPTAGQIPFTPQAKKVLELALREALGRKHTYIGPEHILLGIVRENRGAASRVLREFDADAEKVRERVVTMCTPLSPGATPPPGPVGPWAAIETGWLDGLSGILPGLGKEIRKELGRDPDLGDLLLAAACARASLAGQALAEIGVDLDALWGTLERIRQQRSGDAERRTGEDLSPDVLAEIRRRLGLPGEA